MHGEPCELGRGHGVTRQAPGRPCTIVPKKGLAGGLEPWCLVICGWTDTHIRCTYSERQSFAGTGASADEYRPPTSVQGLAPHHDLAGQRSKYVQDFAFSWPRHAKGPTISNVSLTQALRVYGKDAHAMYAGVLVERCCEWSRLAFVCQADFARACESVRHTEMHECMDRRGATLGAYVRDMRSTRVVFKHGLLGCRRGHTWHRRSPRLQPIAFRWTMTDMSGEMGPVWRQAGGGQNRDGPCSAYICWAGETWLLATWLEKLLRRCERHRCDGTVGR